MKSIRFGMYGLGIGLAWVLSAQPGLAVNWGNCSVEQNVLTITGTSATITPTDTITDTTQAFVLATASGDSTQRTSNNHLVTAEINGGGQVVFTRQGATGTGRIAYSIIQCEDGDKIRVQRGTITLSSGTTSNTATLATAVDINNSILISSVRSSVTTASDNQAMATLALDDSLTVRAQRAAASTSDAYVHYELVEFLSGSGVTVQTGEVTLASGVASTPVTLGAIADPDRTWVLCNYDATSNGLQQTSIACYQADTTTVTVTRGASSAYTNRVRIYTVTWPANTVTVLSGNESNDPTTADDTKVEHNIAIPHPGADINSSFSYITNTVTGTATTYPRNRWVNYIVDADTLRTVFWRSDAAGSTDANTKYWQVINFPLPYEVKGWGWIGNSAGGAFGTGLISFNCGNLNAYTGQACGDGTAGTRYDYGVSMRWGGCLEACDVEGQAWVGWYDSSDTGGVATIGMIDFDPTISNAVTLPPNIVGDDSTTTEDETLDAHWNETTGELYGWARFRALEDYEDTLGGTNDDWGWINLRGNIGTNLEYGVDFDVDTTELVGWAWNDNGTNPTSGLEVDGSGFGWLKFDLLNTGTVSDAWLRTTQADIYSQQGFSSSTDASVYGENNATYLILHNGTLTNFNSALGSSGEVIEDLGGVPTDNTNNVYRGDLGSLYVNELIATADELGNSETGDCDDTLVSSDTNPLGGQVFYCEGDLTLDNNLTLYNATGTGVGSGTIVVGGDLYINDDINYYNDAIDQNVNNLASVAFVVLGRVEIASTVTNLVGAYIVLGDADPTVSGNYDFETGSSTSPLELNGLVMARSFGLSRTSVGTSTDPAPSEDFRYDGRMVANPPPGLENFASLLPVYD